MDWPLEVRLPQPSVEIMGLRVDEPMATLTDLLVSAVCFYAFYQLRRRNLQGRTHFFFRLYFLLMAAATLVGGLIGHGFIYLFTFAWKLPAWVISMCSVALIERSAIEYAKGLVRPGLARFFLALNIVELLTVGTITMSTLNFRWVEFHTAYGLAAVVLPFHTYVYFKTRSAGSRIIMLAVPIAGMAAFSFIFRISIHTWFNYLDVSHTFMALSAYVFYLGALRLDEGGGSRSRIAKGVKS